MNDGRRKKKRRNRRTPKRGPRDGRWAGVRAPRLVGPTAADAMPPLAGAPKPGCACALFLGAASGRGVGDGGAVRVGRALVG